MGRLKTGSADTGAAAGANEKKDEPASKPGTMAGTLLAGSDPCRGAHNKAEASLRGGVRAAAGAGFGSCFESCMYLQSRSAASASKVR